MTDPNAKARETFLKSRLAEVTAERDYFQKKAAERVENCINMEMERNKLRELSYLDRQQYRLDRDHWKSLAEKAREALEILAVAYWSESAKALFENAEKGK